MKYVIKSMFNMSIVVLYSIMEIEALVRSKYDKADGC